jgi:tetratricopeptide (TPR) repeat protein
MIESGTRTIRVLDEATAILKRLGAPTDAVRLLPASTTDLTRSIAVHQAAAGSAAFTSALPAPTATDTVLDEIEFQLTRIATAYVHAPLWPLFVDLERVRDQTFALLLDRQRPWHTRRLYLLAGTACLLMAHASQNLGGHEDAARVQINAAMTCADEAGHEGLRAWARGTSALIAEWSPQHRLAVRLAADAHEHAPRGHGRIRSAAIEARAAARLGDEARARAALDRLHRAQEHTEHDDGLGDFGGLLTFPTAKQAYYTGSTYSLLGDHETALGYSLRAIGHYESGLPEERSYGDEALARLDATAAYLALGGIEEADRQLQAVLAIPAERRISQLGPALDRLLSALERPALAGNSRIAELADATRRFRGASSPSALPSAP